MRALSKADINHRFLSTLDSKTKGVILANIANHYGTTTDAILSEVTGEGAEHLLDYITGPIRSTVHLMMRQKGCSL